MIDRRHLALVVTCLLAGCGGKASGTSGNEGDADTAVVAQAMLGPVAATLTMTPKEPRFGDRIRFVFDVVANQGVALELPEFGARIGHFRIRDRKDESDLAHGRVRETITAEAERSGINIGRLPPLLFRVLLGEGAGDEQVLVVPPFEVAVAGLTPDQRPDLAGFSTALPPVTLPAERDRARDLWIAAGAVLVASAFGAWWWLRRRRAVDAPAVAVDPALEAARAFDLLVAARLIEQGRLAEFYVGMTGIVRRFIERTTGIHAPEQTTEEFLRAMEGNAAIAPPRQRELTEFLAAADLVKFAAQVPSSSEIAIALESARAFCKSSPPSGEAAA